MDARSIMLTTFGIAIFFILLTNIVAPYWNSAGDTNVTSTGFTQASWRSIIQIVGIAFIFGVAYKVIQSEL